MAPSLLAIVPAKHDSVRLPKKNHRLLGDKPLIVHTIAAALQAVSITRLIVSTDSLELTETASRAGAEVPFLRPPELATPSATMVEVVRHAVLFLQAQAGRSYDYFMVLQPTSPLRLSGDIDRAFQQLVAANADSIVSVAQNPIPNSHLVTAEQATIKPFPELAQPQPHLKLYRLNGAIYCSRMPVLLENNRLLGARVIPYWMPLTRSVDIDTSEDFAMAAALLEFLK